MANKLFLVCATLAFCILLTNASIYRTIVEVDEEDTTNPGPYGPQKKCQREFQQARHLRACQQWMHTITMQPRLDGDELDFENTWGPQHPTLERCCNELRQEDTVCVCPTLKQAAEAVRLRRHYETIRESQIYQTAKALPSVCNISQVGVCPFSAIPFFPPY